MRAGKKGSSDWTIQKLLKIVLLVIVLVLVFYGVAEGMTPSLEQVELKFYEVASMLKFWEDDIGGPCYEDDVSSVFGGDKFLRDMGLEGKDVKIGRCGGVCNVSGEGIDEYRLSAGGIERLGVLGWESFVYFLSGDVKSESENWEIYHKGTDLISSVFGGDEFLKGEVLTNKFVLYGDDMGEGDDVIMEWMDGVWRIKKGGDILFETGDDNKALDFFYEEVDDFFEDDLVYWKVLNREDVYNKELDKGEVIGTFLAEGVVEFHNLYNAIMAAEHRAEYDEKTNRLRVGYNPWIRTGFREAKLKIVADSGVKEITRVQHGSTAYGPVQLTMGLARGYLEGNSVSWSVEEKDYLERFIDQGCMFLLHGNMKSQGTVDVSQLNSVSCGEFYRSKGISKETKYEEKYDYGGSGDLIYEEDKEMYRQVAIKMLDEMFERNGGNYDKLWREWRFGVNNNGKEDKEYEDFFTKARLKGIEEEKGVEEGQSQLERYKIIEYDKKLNEENFEVLKKKFLEVKSDLVYEVSLSSAEVDRVRETVEGKSFEFGGKEFVLSVEERSVYVSEDAEEGVGLIVVMDSSEEKFGLKYAVDAKRIVDFGTKSVELEDFPFVLVYYDNDRWKRIGDESSYKLSRNNFEEVVYVSLINNFLREVCR